MPQVRHPIVLGERASVIARPAPQLEDSAVPGQPAIEQEPSEHFWVTPPLPAVLQCDGVVVEAGHGQSP